MKKQQPWYVILKRERQRHGWSQVELADKIGSISKTVSRWENGQTQMPGPYLRQQLAMVFNRSIEELGLLIDQEVQEKEEIKSSDFVRTLSMPKSWGEAPHTEHFLGREHELELISRWIKNDGSRLIVIQGLGGMGKTTLATMLTKQLQDSFNLIYWHSLQQAPTLEHFLEHYLQFVFHTRQAHLPKDGDEQLSLFLTCLREQSCLLILDNFKSILSTGQRAGKYLKEYEDYGRLLHLIGESDHASCLVLTSREKPGEVARMERKNSAVCTLQLGGMEQLAIRELLKDQALYGSDEMWANLVHLYSGNPLALKLVADPIRRIFGGISPAS